MKMLVGILKRDGERRYFPREHSTRQAETGPSLSLPDDSLCLLHEHGRSDNNHRQALASITNSSALLMGEVIKQPTSDEVSSSSTKPTQRGADEESEGRESKKRKHTAFPKFVNDTTNSFKGSIGGNQSMWNERYYSYFLNESRDHNPS